MSTYFFYEDGQGRIFDEKGDDAMEWEEDVNPFHLETLTNIRRYCIAQEPLQASMATDLDARIVKLFNAAKSGRLAGGIAERTAQKWAKTLKEDKDWNILQKQTNKVNRKKSELDEEHKVHLINFYDDHPQARVSDAVTSLTEKFENFSLKDTSVRNFLKKECNFSFKKITRHPAAINDETKIANCLAWVEKRSQTDMNFLEIASS